MKICDRPAKTVPVRKYDVPLAEQALSLKNVSLQRETAGKDHWPNLGNPKQSEK